MSTTKLFWQRDKPLADFSNGINSDLIIVTTHKGAAHVIDDIFDDCRNDSVNLLALIGDGNGGIHFSSLEQNGIELKEAHNKLCEALASANREISDRTGSVVIIDNSSITIDSTNRDTIASLMESPEVHVVVIVPVEGMEAMQHYLSSNPLIVIETDEQAQLVSF